MDVRAGRLLILDDKDQTEEEQITDLQDPSGPVTLRTSKFITNRLLNRKQFVITVLHPTRANLSRDELSEKLASLYKTDKARVVVFGLKTKFGGGSSQGFGMVYDDEESQKKFEPKHRLVRVSVVVSFMSYRCLWRRRENLNGGGQVFRGNGV